MFGSTKNNMKDKPLIETFFLLRSSCSCLSDIETRCHNVVHCQGKVFRCAIEFLLQRSVVGHVLALNCLCEEHVWSTCSVVRGAWPQGQISEWPTLNLWYMCRRLCPVRNRNIMVCWLRVIPWMGLLGSLSGWSLFHFRAMVVLTRVLVSAYELPPSSCSRCDPSLAS